MSDDPIGIFDSGSGGLSFWQSITSLLPHESTVYIGDHNYLPYGEKDTEFIQERTISCIRFLLKHHAKLIVIGCNTATVAGIDVYRTAFPDIPIIGVVPVLKTAAELTKKGSIGVLSTPYTAHS